MSDGGYATPRRNWHWHIPKQRLSIGGTGTTSSTRTPNVHLEHLEPNAVHVEDRHHEDKKQETDDAAGTLTLTWTHIVVKKTSLLWSLFFRTNCVYSRMTKRDWIRRRRSQ
jgi:hypothetical protein